MKMTILTTLCLSAAVLTAAEKTVLSDVAVEQSPDDLGVAITYTLEGCPAIVLADVETNGVSIGREHLCGLSGNVNSYVSTGALRRICWPADADWPGQMIADGSLKVKLTAYALDNPPDYMVFDLETPHDVRFYASEADLPLPITDRLYKTTSLVMRRIHAANKVWCMGTPSLYTEMGCNAVTSDEHENISIPHLVSLTKDYYIAVYPVTQEQHRWIVGDYTTHYKMNSTRVNPSGFASATDMTAAEDVCLRPVEKVSHKTLRGTTTDDGSGYDWPQNGHDVAENSFFDYFRKLTGITTLDLPTDAQWEFACRAGTVTGLNSGKEVTTKKTSGTACANLAELGWYGGNPNSSYYGNAKDGQTQPVGLLKPNRWGLYDMHGNVWEQCLDRYSAGDDYRATFAAGWQNGAVTVDPAGPTTMTATTVIMRGCDYWYGPTYARSGYRFSSSSLTRENVSTRYGFRPVCEANLK